MAKKKSHEDFCQDIENLTNGDFSLHSGCYCNNLSKINIIHNVCGKIFLVRASNFLYHRNCPFCIKSIKKIGNRKTQDSFIQELFNKKGKEYTLLGEYKTAKNKVVIRHSCGYEWDVIPDNILNKSGCPMCAGVSKGEILINEYLTKKGFYFERQKKFDSCRGLGKRRLPFDFCIFNDDKAPILLVEYQGSQHTIPLGYFGGLDKLLYTQCHDIWKRTWANNNSITIVQIDYKDIKNIDLILDNHLLFYSKEVYIE